MQTTAADAAVVCLRVLRRLLQDEETSLAQLNYVLENLHDPLAQVCLPPSQRPLVTTATPLLSSSSAASTLSRFGSPSKHAASAPLETATAAAAAGRRQAPQPALTGARVEEPAAASLPPVATGKAGKTAGRLHKSGSSSGAAKKGTTVTTSACALTRVPLTFSQYWDLFANLPTLCMVHLTLVQQLDTVIERLTYLVEELHPTVGGTGDQTGAAEEPQGNPPHLSVSSLATRKHVSALRHSPSAAAAAAAAAAGPRSVFNEIGTLVCELFGAELMRHYTAEHMMYTVKYTQRTAPLLLRLSRLWRWCDATDLGALSEADRDVVQQHALFLDFVWRTLGASGVPADDRVQLPTPPEVRQARAAAGSPTAAAAPTAAGPGTGGAVSSAKSPFLAAEVLGAAAGGGGGSSGAGGARRQRPSPAVSGSSTVPLPPIPATWEGFSTLLHLLATPLNTLRRYCHVARCLVESGALLPKDRDRLQYSFVDVAALRLSEEVNLVMEELCLHDVTSIMALMDMPSGSPGGTSGGGGVGLVSGAHAGHTVAEGSGMSGATPAPGVVAAAAAARTSGDYTNRALIHYGRLVKRFGRGRHERLAFLFSDWMCYVEECSNGRFRVRGTIPLPGLRVVQVRDDPSLDTVNCFELVSPSLPKRVIFYAATPEQRDQWIDAIRYTVRRFAESQQQQQQQRQAALSRSSNSLHRSSVAVPAVTTAGDGDIASVMRDTAPMLPPNSRLSRQRRNDGVWQDYVDVQRRLAEMALLAGRAVPAAATAGAAGLSTPSLAGFSVSASGGVGVGGAGGAGLPSFSSVVLSPPAANLPSSDPSRDGSFAGQRSASAHRQLDYDVTPWSQRASVHRRIRSQDLIVAHQQQQQMAGGSSSSRIATPPRPAGGVPGTRSGSEMDGADGEVDSPLPPQDERGSLAHATPQPSLASSSAQSAYQQLPGPTGRHSSSSAFRSFNLDNAVGGSRGGGAAGTGTPLRRPVSERFEAVKMSGSTTALLPLAQHQRTSSTSLRNSLVAAPRDGSSDAPHTPPPENLATSPGAGSTGGAHHVPPLSPGVAHAGDESGGDRVVLADSSSADDASEPVHGGAEVLASPSASPRGDGRGAVDGESGRSSSSSGVLASIIDEPSHTDAAQSPLRQQQPDSPAGRDAVSSHRAPGSAAVVPGASESMTASGSAEERPGAAAAVAAGAEHSGVSPADQLEPSVSVSGVVDEDEATTASATVTAFQPTAVMHDRLMSPFSPPTTSMPVVSEGHGGNGAAPTPPAGQQASPAAAAAALSDSPTDFDADLQRMMEAEEPALGGPDRRRHVDPLHGMPAEGSAEMH